MSRTVIVVPCYNEEHRLPVPCFSEFARRTSGVRFLFVDDGSRDGTLAVLTRLQQQAPDRFRVHRLDRNSGKAEAVRQGCLAAFAGGAEFVGYWDADLATPLEAIPEFLQVFREQPGVELVCGARVRLLGRSVQRRRLRHYLGRVFATAASWVLGLTVYDTQCGAKLFRASPRVTSLFTQPFLTRWLFDVEILGRLVAVGRAAGSPVEQAIYELPLKEWHDVPGSKLKPRDFAKALLELTAIHWAYLRPGARWVPSPATTLAATDTHDPPLAA